MKISRAYRSMRFLSTVFLIVELHALSEAFVPVQPQTSKQRTTFRPFMTINNQDTVTVGLPNDTTTNNKIPPYNTIAPPPNSPATNLENKIYEWKSQSVRYQVAGDPSSPHAVVLVHGLFVNSDHWRRTLTGLADAGYRAYALDLLGSGYSSKPRPDDSEVRSVVCGEVRRFERGGVDGVDGDALPSVLKDVTLGTASGKTRIAPAVDLRHPLQSHYNFYTWADQIADFTRDIVLRNDNNNNDKPSNDNLKEATLVANSIGTISSLQSLLDYPNLYNGIFIVNPNFRELHTAELPLSNLFTPILRSIQSLLRSKGQTLFDLLAKPNTVQQILTEPYARVQAVDDELVSVLLDPLLTPGASDVVFDTLSYSAGPLPEQQLGDANFPKVPVEVCYGSEDPWTPPARVEALVEFLPSVGRVVRLEGVGHCPHDEAPELVNPLLVEFLEKVTNKS